MTEQDLTISQQLLLSMINKTIPHGLKLRLADDYKKTHRDVEVSRASATSAMAGNPLLRVTINAYPERDDESKANNVLIHDDDVEKWTIKKQEDGRFLMAQKKHLKEEVDEPILVSMLRRLEPMMKQHRVFYKADATANTSTVVGWEVTDPLIVNNREILAKSVNFRVLPPEKYATHEPWVASITWDRLDSFTIKSDGEGDSKTWTVQLRSDINESAELPILVSLLKRVIADHFKNGGPEVKILDTDFEDEPMPIRGYRYLPDGSLEISMKGKSGWREVIYPVYLLQNDRLKFKPGTKGRLLVVEAIEEDLVPFNIKMLQKLIDKKPVYLVRMNINQKYEFDRIHNVDYTYPSDNFGGMIRLKIDYFMPDDSIGLRYYDIVQPVGKEGQEDVEGTWILRNLNDRWIFHRKAITDAVDNLPGDAPVADD